MADDAIPIGEGWARHNNELLVHPPSQVYFAQRGDQRGKYLLKTGQGFSVCPAPHVGNLTGLELRMSWSCMAIEGAVVVFSRLHLCRVSKHSTISIISIDFQYPLVSVGPSCSRFKCRRVATLMLPKYAKFVSLNRFLFGLWFVQLCQLYKIEVWPNINQTDSRDGFIQLTKVSCISLIQSHCFESYTK